MKFSVCSPKYTDFSKLDNFYTVYKSETEIQILNLCLPNFEFTFDFSSLDKKFKLTSINGTMVRFSRTMDYPIYVTIDENFSRITVRHELFMFELFLKIL